jgi:RNA polymerase-binding protein DksA
MAVEETDPRVALEEERSQLQAQLVEHGGGVQHDDNFADSGQVAAEQGENRALVGQLEETLAEVERALAKLDEGSYGSCESCGKPISEARLEAMPATRYCIDCAN